MSNVIEDAFVSLRYSSSGDGVASIGPPGRSRVEAAVGGLWLTLWNLEVPTMVVVHKIAAINAFLDTWNPELPTTANAYEGAVINALDIAFSNPEGPSKVVSYEEAATRSPVFNFFHPEPEATIVVYGEAANNGPYVKWLGIGVEASPERPAPVVVAPDISAVTARERRTRNVGVRLFRGPIAIGRRSPTGVRHLGRTGWIVGAGRRREKATPSYAERTRDFRLRGARIAVLST